MRSLSFNLIFFFLVSRQERDITRLVSDDLLLTQSIFITDKFGFDESKASRNVNNTETPFIVANYQDACINSYGKDQNHRKLRMKRF
jgi:hypothetical protein